MKKDSESKKVINPVEKFEASENFLNSKKEKILSLRKKNNKKRNIYRIIREKEIKEKEKYKIYEFEKSDFTQIKTLYKIKNKSKSDIYELSFEELKSKDYNDEELKYWLYSMCKTSMCGKKHQ